MELVFTEIYEFNFREKSVFLLSFGVFRHLRLLDLDGGILKTSFLIRNSCISSKFSIDISMEEVTNYDREKRLRNFL